MLLVWSLNARRQRMRFVAPKQGNIISPRSTIWIISQFNPAKKSIVEVQGYETMPGASRMRGGQVGRDKSDTVPVSVSIGNMESSNVSGESGKSLAHQSKMKFAATL